MATRPTRAILLLLFTLILLAGCDIPKPPPELPTATAGSQNPESADARPGTPVRIEPERRFTPLSVPLGWVYFVRASGLWKVKPDGNDETELASLPVTAVPQPSPDGNMVAFISGQDLYVVPSSGGEAHKIFSGDLAERQRIGWAPDSKTIGFVTYDPTVMGGEKAWAISASGGQPALINSTTHGIVGRGASYESIVEWSPDGYWVVVSGSNNPLQILRWPPSTGNADDVREVPGGEPDWSPDSRNLVLTESVGGALQIFDIRSSKATPFRTEQQPVGTGVGEYGQGPGPRWSPASIGADSDIIAYRSMSPQGEPRVSVRQRNARELNPLPSLTNNPSWGPSGDRLVVETGYLKADPLGPHWTPNGLSIAVLDLVGGEHKLTPLVKDAWWPAWGR
ncbi:MAG TPA: hypothetical protein VM409_03265 [Chloroflexia bacterium]|nr:hypothetical protein [Chloroflexia bacterium]